MTEGVRRDRLIEWYRLKYLVKIMAIVRNAAVGYESNKSSEWISASLSYDVRQGVYSRMDSEKQEALTMFTKEIN